MTFTTAITQHKVRLALAEEEAAELEQGKGITIHDDISPAHSVIIIC
jgi:hypothetical protein